MRRATGPIGSDALGLVIMMGLQASGKSSFVRAHLATSHEVAIKDVWPNARNQQRRQLALVNDHLGNGRPVVVDNTNPSVADRAPLIKLGREHGAAISGYWLESNVQACVVRNAARRRRERVPDIGLYATVGQLTSPNSDEGFNELFFVRLTDGGAFMADAWIEENRRGQ